MINIFSTVKGKVILGIAAFIMVVTLVTVVVVMNRGFRVIVVDELDGATTVTNGNYYADAYVGLRLRNGDDVKVGSNADMTLEMDMDKYMYAEPSTHFWLSATGKSGATKTIVHLDDGSTLIRIDDKLAEKESFNVETPNATMSVRGTVFRVSYTEDVKGDGYTKIEVYEGSVYTESVMEDDRGDVTDSKVLTAGMSAIIRSDPKISEFLGSGTAEIEYKEIPKKAARFLGKAIDEGRSLCISKELLFDYVEINPHVFDARGEGSVAATCTEGGFYYPACSVCGILNGEMVEEGPAGHKETTIEERGATCGDAMTVKVVCEVCGEVFSSKVVKGDHKWDAGTVSLQPKCTEEGTTLFKCEICGETTTASIPATGHNFVETGRSDPKCDENGTLVETCSICNEIKTSSIPSTGHSYSETASTAPGCTTEGSSTRVCSVCGDTYIKAIPAKGHTFVANDRAEASCMEDGAIYYACECGEITFEVVPATGHSDIYYATDGAGHYEVCGVCGDTLTESQPHDYPRDDTGVITGNCTTCGAGY